MLQRHRKRRIILFKLSWTPLIHSPPVNLLKFPSNSLLLNYLKSLWKSVKNHLKRLETPWNSLRSILKLLKFPRNSSETPLTPSKNLQPKPSENPLINPLFENLQKSPLKLSEAVLKPVQISLKICWKPAKSTWKNLLETLSNWMKLQIPLQLFKSHSKPSKIFLLEAPWNPLKPHWSIPRLETCWNSPETDL